MAPFLSPAWIDAMDEAARSSDRLAALASGLDLVVEHRVTGAGPDGGEIVFHLALGEGGPRVVAGAAASPSITFSQDLDTARAIASGAGSAQLAFMSGALRVGGDLRVLLDHQEALAAIGDVFSEVRAATELGVASDHA